jgi:hypothetical protein
MIDVAVLAAAVRDGRCLLFTGPDLAVVSTPQGRQTLHDRIAAQLYRTLGPHDTAPGQGLSHVAQMVADRQGEYPVQLAAKLEIEQFAETTTDTYRRLASMDISHYISTSFDLFLETAIRRAGKTPDVHYFNFRKGPDRSVIELFDQNDEPKHLPGSPLIYHLFGSVQKQSSLVLTENDIIDYLLSVGQENLPKDLSNLIADPTRIRLFVGFGLYQWHLRILLRVIDRFGRKESDSGFRTRETSYSFEAAASNGVDPALQSQLLLQARVFYSQPGHRIEFADMDAEQFVEQLEREFHNARGRRTAEAVPPSGPLHFREDPPLIFLSYAREDSAEMERIEARLEAAGIKTWKDGRDLDAGTDWSSEIEGAIGRADYVIFVQSKRTSDPRRYDVAEIQGWWKKELAWSRDRATLFEPFIFLIPVAIEECEPFPGLGSRQLVRFFDADGPEKLLTAIYRDWTVRRKNRLSANEVKQSQQE